MNSNQGPLNIFLTAGSWYHVEVILAFSIDVSHANKLICSAGKENNVQCQHEGHEQPELHAIEKLEAKSLEGAWYSPP